MRPVPLGWGLSSPGPPKALVVPPASVSQLREGRYHPHRPNRYATRLKRLTTGARMKSRGGRHFHPGGDCTCLHAFTERSLVRRRYIGDRGSQWTTKHQRRPSRPGQETRLQPARLRPMRSARRLASKARASATVSRHAVERRAAGTALHEEHGALVGRPPRTGTHLVFWSLLLLGVAAVFVGPMRHGFYRA